MLLSLVVHTANILGIFTDPFEFEGDYGQKINPIRQKVFETVVSKEALARSENRDVFYIQEAIQEDRETGPILAELVTPQLRRELERKQKSLKGFSVYDLEAMLIFLEKYKSQKLFYFLRKLPAEFIGLDKPLRSQAALEGRAFDLPILGSPEPLRGKSNDALKRNLLEALFTEETLRLAPSKETLKKRAAQIPLRDLLGDEASSKDLTVFCSPAGQAFLYWLYHSLNLHLIAEWVDQVNTVKEWFAHDLGNPQTRAETLLEQLLKADSAILFTQESDAIVPDVLSKEYYSVKEQNPHDGTFVFLRSAFWEPDYERIPLDGYSGYQSGGMSLILATLKESGEKFLLVAGHGHSTKPEDGRLQVKLAMDKFHELAALHKGLQIIIGIDANTKSEEDVRLFREQAEALGLVTTSVGPTTVKRRLVTVQHSKTGRFAFDEEDYLLILKEGRYRMTHPTVGFREEKPDPETMLPNIFNPSDHYSVGVTLQAN